MTGREKGNQRSYILIVNHYFITISGVIESIVDFLQSVSKSSQEYMDHTLVTHNIKATWWFKRPLNGIKCGRFIDNKVKISKRNLSIFKTVV